jgi:hypothetical protein
MRDARHFPTFALWWSWLCAVNYRGIARRLLVALSALTVLGSCLLAAAWNYQRCMGMANSFERMGGCFVCRRQLDDGPLTLEEQRLARWYEAKVRRYRVAAWLPLVLLIPDPPRPTA